MEIKTFDPARLAETKRLLEDVFRHENSSAVFNEWEFVEKVLRDKGFRPELCLTAWEKGKVIGYIALTTAAIGGAEGLALGPLGVGKAYRNRGVGTQLVKEGIARAEAAGEPWIVLLGGANYSRFGFEAALPYGITVSDREFENAHLQILFLRDGVKGRVSGKLAYCGSFYDENGNLL